MYAYSVRAYHLRDDVTNPNATIAINKENRSIMENKVYIISENRRKFRGMNIHAATELSSFRVPKFSAHKELLDSTRSPLSHSLFHII